ncbi:uncharacterized protein LOC107763695 isoform X1 [Nicotiana tabacum]|uniref:Uncharacterized protein LOC107763695 isoform X1 n=1 Tax=Nicotiana tabacum TaxID=4097 RepID=A0AC58TUF5_TOBAC
MTLFQVHWFAPVPKHEGEECRAARKRQLGALHRKQSSVSLFESPSGYISKIITIYILTSHRFKPPHHAKQSLVFKWRRVEGRAHYPPSFEGCGWSKGSAPDGFLGHQKKKKGTQHCSKGPLCRDHHKATLAGTV